MARPYKLKQVIDLHPMHQLSKAIDLGHNHVYRFESEETFILDSTTAQELLNALQEMRSDVRNDVCLKMMKSLENFRSEANELIDHQV